MAPPPKITADYLINELGLVVGKETFEARSLGRLAELQQRIFMAKGNAQGSFQDWQIATYTAQALHLPRLFVAMKHLLSAQTSPCLHQTDPSKMTKKDAEKLYSIMQRTEIFSMIACNLSGLVSFLRAKPEVYLDVEGLILLMHHYSARNWTPSSPAEIQILPFAINNTCAFLQFSAFHEIIRSTYHPTSKGKLPFPSHPLSMLALSSFDTLSKALEANVHHGFKEGSETAKNVKTELEGTLAFWKAFFSLTGREEGVSEEEVIEFGTFLVVCEDEGMGNCEGTEGRGIGNLICANCKTARYCSRGHQRSSWKAHKKICVRPCWVEGP